MNAMARAAAATAAPDFVIVNDGRPVASVEQSSRFLRLGKIAAIVLVPLLVGVAVGQMGTNAKILNRTIEDAGKIAVTVKAANDDLQALRNLLYTHKTHGPAGASFKTGDTDLTAALEALTLSTPDIKVVYDSYLYEMDAAVIDQTLAFFTETQLLFKDIKNHIQQATADAKAITVADQKIQKLGGPTRFAIYLELPEADAPADATTRANFVELGTPLCAPAQPGQPHRPNPDGCGGSPATGFLYRPDESGPWGSMLLTETLEEGTPDRKLIPLALTPVLATLFGTAAATLSAQSYDSRIRDIDAKVDDLMERGKALQKQLTGMSGQGKQFTFFL
jgi:hypothetical protein